MFVQGGKRMPTYGLFGVGFCSIVLRLPTVPAYKVTLRNIDFYIGAFKYKSKTYLLRGYYPTVEQIKCELTNQCLWLGMADKYSSVRER